jgi:transposase
MRLYAAFDLHSSNSYLGISDEKGKRIFKKKLLNDPARIKEALRPFKAEIEGIVVESTYNCTFWLICFGKRDTGCIWPM